MSKMNESEPARWREVVRQHVDDLERDPESYKGLLLSDNLKPTPSAGTEAYAVIGQSCPM